MKRLILLSTLLFTIVSVYSQKIKIYGYIIDKNTKEKLLNAYVKTDEENVVLTNEFGYYSIIVNLSKTKEITYSYIGYRDTVLQINFVENHRIDVFLTQNLELGQIIVEAKKKENLEYYNTITPKQIKLTPHIMGERDIMKNFQLLPGVQFGVEGSADLYVRGGTPDQNTIIIDDIPIYYTNHFGSFFSIFDENAINTANIYKYGFPARFGSTLSSLIDIRTKDGNMKKSEGEITVGLVSSKISLNGPIIKDKLSYIFNFRLCNYFFPSYIIRLVNPNSFNKYVYYYTDFNVKFNYIVSPKNKIDFTFYRGIDKNQILYDDKSIVSLDNIRNTSELNNIWGNWLTSFRWTHSYGSNLFQKLVVGYTSFDYKTYNDKYVYESARIISKDVIQTKSFVGNIIAKLNWDWFITNTSKINFGFFANKQIYIPHYENIIYENSDIDTVNFNFTLGKHLPTEGNFYFDFQKKFQGFVINLSYLYNIFKNDSTYKNTALSVRFEFFLSKKNKLTLSYDKSFQNKHLLCNYSVFSPNSVWLPVDSLHLPISSQQFSLNYTLNVPNFEISISPFLKLQNNLIDYNHSTFTNDTSSNTFENSLIKGGNGEIFGFEAMFNGTFKKIFFQASYTYMKNYRRFMDYRRNFATPFIFDRRHFVQVYVNCNISKSFSINANFIFGTGYPANSPVLMYLPAKEKEPTSNFTEYLNNYYTYDLQYETVLYNNQDNPRYIYVSTGIIENLRLPAYHRLDLSFVWSKEKKSGTRTWSIDIYNAYNHLNTIFLTAYLEEDKLKIEKFALFPILPSISYRYKF